MQLNKDCKSELLQEIVWFEGLHENLSKVRSEKTKVCGLYALLPAGAGGEIGPLLYNLSPYHEVTTSQPFKIGLIFARGKTSVWKHVGKHIDMGESDLTHVLVMPE